MGDNKISEAAPALWGVRIGDSDTWGYVEVESDADFIGRKSGLSYEKRPFYTHLQGEAVPVAWQSRRTERGGSAWEHCTEELYEAIRLTGCYPGPGGVLMEARALFTHPQPAELNEVSGISGELPPLPKMKVVDLHLPTGVSIYGYTAEQMQDYARAALAATGKQQVGEVQGDALNEARKLLAKHLEKEDPSAAQKLRLATPMGLARAPTILAALTAIAEAASRQPVGLSPIATRKLEELAAQGYVTNGVAIFNPETGKRGLVDNLGYVGWQRAQGIDLGAVRELLTRRRAQWVSHLPNDPNAPGARAIRTIVPPHWTEGETDYNNDVALYRQGITLMDEALALIDGRDAGTEVGDE